MAIQFSKIVHQIDQFIADPFKIYRTSIKKTLDSKFLIGPFTQLALGATQICLRNRKIHPIGMFLVWTISFPLDTLLYYGIIDAVLGALISLRRAQGADASELCHVQRKINCFLGDFLSEWYVDPLTRAPFWAEKRVVRPLLKPLVRTEIGERFFLYLSKKHLFPTTLPKFANSSKKIALESLKNQHYKPGLLSKKLRADPDFILEYAAQIESASEMLEIFENTTASLKNNADFVLKFAIQMIAKDDTSIRPIGMLFRQASDSLKNDPDFIIELLKIADSNAPGDILEELRGRPLTRDKAFIMRIGNEILASKTTLPLTGYFQNGFSVFLGTLLEDIEFLKNFVLQFPSEIAEDLQDWICRARGNKFMIEFITRIAEKNWRIVPFSGPEIQDNTAIVLNAVKQNPKAYPFASERLRQRPEIAVWALSLLPDDHRVALKYTWIHACLTIGAGLKSN